ncbi:YkgJ family cysteine cluster protein [uncultured Devosia sp.]|uniref:YkgJ family cysteine cluster protein n=1 Tax=uncultured Devosia sp. TaxID=211434 RepID=UPI002613F3AE|nr:YkgJ family cysteine cluster protein [uncultured Devosia sp.]
MTGQKSARAVPCGECTICCRGGEAITLHPEDGDVPAFYQTSLVRHPLTGAPIQILKQKPDGSCIYLGATGCTIYERRPVICKAFDCRLFAKRIKGELRRKILADGLGAAEVFERGEQMARLYPP